MEPTWLCPHFRKLLTNLCIKMEITHFVKYLHYIAIFLVFATLFLEMILLKPVIKREVLKIVFKIDGYYGMGAMAVVAAGLILWLGVGKPAEFYSQNGIIYLKLGLFIVVGLLSIIPTVFFFRNRKGDDADEIEIPARVRMIVRLELLILLIIPMLAVLMANGIEIF